MRNLDLTYFDLPKDRKYHIYRINGSAVSQPHSHDYYSISYVDCGHIDHMVGNSKVRLNAGDTFIIPPGVVHNIEFCDKNAFIYSLSFDQNLFDTGFTHTNIYSFITALNLESASEKGINIRGKVTLNFNQRYIIKALLDSLILEQQEAFPQQLSAAASLVASVVSILSQGYFMADENRASLEDITQYSKSIAECVEYLDSHFTQPFTLSDLCQKFALSRSKFGILFPQYTGMTLKKYIASKRVAHAALLLQNTSLPINEIASICGYNDTSTFYRNFIKIYGAPPSSLRDCNR